MKLGLTIGMSLCCFALNSSLAHAVACPPDVCNGQDNYNDQIPVEWLNAVDEVHSALKRIVSRNKPAYCPLLWISNSLNLHNQGINVYNNTCSSNRNVILKNIVEHDCYHIPGFREDHNYATALACETGDYSEVYGFLMDPDTSGCVYAGGYSVYGLSTACSTNGSWINTGAVIPSGKGWYCPDSHQAWWLKLKEEAGCPSP